MLSVFISKWLDIPCSPFCSSQQACIQGVCVGTGYLSIVMTWSRVGDGDIVVSTPNSNVICYTNKGPGSLTDFGQLDVDDKTGTGPENVFWSNSTGSSLPPNGIYYVCFEPYAFTANASVSNPIFVTARVFRTSNTALTFRRNFTSYQTDNYECGPSSSTLLGSFSYPWVAIYRTDH